MKSKTREANSSSMSKRSTESGKQSSSDEIYKKYNINERLIKILLKEIYIKIRTERIKTDALYKRE